MSIFSYDASKQCLIFPHPDNGQPIGLRVSDIEKADYWEPKGKLEVELRKCLPRFGPSAIARADPRMMAALNHKRRH